MEKYFNEFTTMYIPRDENDRGRYIGKGRSKEAKHAARCFYEVISKLSVKWERQKKINAIIS
jgi:hypothetical protein